MADEWEDRYGCVRRTELEELGYGAVWFSEAFDRETFTHSALLLAGSTRIVVANGIANRARVFRPYQTQRVLIFSLTGTAPDSSEPSRRLACIRSIARSSDNSLLGCG
jgi:hypothetical protein